MEKPAALICVCISRLFLFILPHALQPLKVSVGAFLAYFFKKIFHFLKYYLRKSEMKDSSKRTNDVDLPFSCGFSLKLEEKSYSLKRAHFFEPNWRLSVCPKENKISYEKLTCASGYALYSEKNVLKIPENMFNVHFLESFFFSKTNLILMLIVS